MIIEKLRKEQALIHHEMRSQENQQNTVEEDIILLANKN